MNKEIKNKWVEALRSGEYKQGFKVLKSSDNHFCCLGVLCDLYSKEHDNVVWEKDSDYNYDFFMGKFGLLPENVVNWSGLTRKNPESKKYNAPLSELNDGGFSFEQIANIIEEEL